MGPRFEEFLVLNGRQGIGVGGVLVSFCGTKKAMAFDLWCLREFIHVGLF
jgi:hypothetical protein